ncbi:MAG: SirB2 family protein [Bacteroidia bacterium]|nr:SirB2 family protein [Bacteroidia bacterium]
MDTGFLHLHVTVVSLFLLQLLAKVVLVAAKKDAFLEKNSKKLKLADMILGTLILVTGGYLLVKLLVTDDPRGTAPYMIVKLFLVCISIPMAIIGMRKKKLVMLVVPLLLFGYVFAVAKTDDLMLRSSATKEAAAEKELASEGTDPDLVRGQAVYSTRCQLCHGADGKLGFQGAKDLSQSELTDAQMSEIVRNGKGVMPAVSERELSNEDIAKVIKYVRTLGKKQE